MREVWDFGDNIKHINILIIAVPEEKEKGSEKIVDETIIKNLPNIGKEIVIQVKEVQFHTE